MSYRLFFCSIFKNSCLILTIACLGFNWLCLFSLQDIYHTVKINQTFASKITDLLLIIFIFLLMLLSVYGVYKILYWLSNWQKYVHHESKAIDMATHYYLGNHLHLQLPVFQNKQTHQLIYTSTLSPDLHAQSNIHVQSKLVQVCLKQHSLCYLACFNAQQLSEILLSFRRFAQEEQLVYISTQNLSPVYKLNVDILNQLTQDELIDLLCMPFLSQLLLSPNEAQKTYTENFKQFLLALNQFKQIVFAYLDVLNSAKNQLTIHHLQLLFNNALSTQKNKLNETAYIQIPEYLQQAIKQFATHTFYFKPIIDVWLNWLTQLQQMFYSKTLQDHVDEQTKKNQNNINQQATIVIQDLQTLRYLHVCIDLPKPDFLITLQKFNDETVTEPNVQFLHHWQYWWHYVYKRLKHQDTNTQKIYFISHYHLATALVQKNPYSEFSFKQTQTTNDIKDNNITENHYKYYHATTANDLQAYLKHHQYKQTLLQKLYQTLNSESQNYSDNQNQPKILIHASLIQLTGIKGMQQLVNSYDMRLEQNQTLKNTHFSKAMQHTVQRLQLLHVCLGQRFGKNTQVIYIQDNYPINQADKPSSIYSVKPLYILNLGFKDVYDVLYR